MIINSDALSFLKTMGDEIVHCAITSPPYFGLRDYKVDGQIGLEKTPEEYVRKMVEIFHELKRVLRSDGTFWLNIGDSYAGSGKGPTGHNGIGNQKERQGFVDPVISTPTGYKAKDLYGIPWMLAFALRTDGWYLRADLPWIKRNSMPSSVTDRPASSIEHVFLFSKSRKYYYDHIATMQPSSESYNKDKRPRGVIRQKVNENTKYDRDNPQYKKQDNVGNNTYTGFNARYENSGTGLRFMRDSDFFFRTWQGLLHNEDGEPMALVVNPRGYKGAHFACFPIQLVEPMILAGTSEKGVCPECGNPWVRNVNKEREWTRRDTGTTNKDAHLQPQGPARSGNSRCGNITVETTGWQPTCTHNLPPIPTLILDPFAGSSATGVACKWHNRNYLGIELNPDYCKLGNQRIEDGK
jgi:DNA modification methylase